MLRSAEELPLWPANPLVSYPAEVGTAKVVKGIIVSGVIDERIPITPAETEPHSGHDRVHVNSLNTGMGSIEQCGYGCTEINPGSPIDAGPSMVIQNLKKGIPIHVC